MHLETGEAIQSLAGDKVVLACAYTGRTREVAVASVVMVTLRQPDDALYHELDGRIEIARGGPSRCGT